MLWNHNAGTEFWLISCVSFVLYHLCLLHSQTVLCEKCWDSGSDGSQRSLCTHPCISMHTQDPLSFFSPDCCSSSFIGVHSRGFPDFLNMFSQSLWHCNGEEDPKAPENPSHRSYFHKFFHTFTCSGPTDEYYVGPLFSLQWSTNFSHVLNEQPCCLKNDFTFQNSLMELTTKTSNGLH